MSMIMKKTKLFMMLALLVMGVSGAWAATQTFNVVYTGRTTSQGAGYEAVTNRDITFRYGSRPITAGRIQTGYTKTQFTVSGNYADYPEYYYESLPNNFIEATEVEGYQASVSISRTREGWDYIYTVTIAYAPMTIKYRVMWDKEFIQGAGYKLTGKNPDNATITSGDDADILVITGTGDNAPTRWDDNTDLSYYITPRAVTGYRTDLYFMPNETQLGYEGTIYVNYHTTATKTITTDGIYDYSNIYTRETGSTIKLPDDECAISLHLTATQEPIEEEKSYYIYCTATVSGSSMSNLTFYDYDPVNDTYTRVNSRPDYPRNDNGLRLNGSSTSGLDDDGDGFGTNATYVYQSKDDSWTQTSEKIQGDNNPVFRLAYTYKVTHTIGISTVQDAVIPLREPEKDIEGNTTAKRKVTAIQKWGFCYKQEDAFEVYNCQIGSDGKVVDSNGDGKIDEKDAISHPSLVNNHRNDYLKTVTFEKDANGQSNLESIGDYAFMSCLQLTDIDIPFSVKYLGQGLFEMDRALLNVNFQTGTIERNDKTYPEGVQFNTIRMFTFWCCTAMETLVLPDGITDIEGQQSGAALQYMTSLINLTLPSTLERIGPHFLCSASALKTLTIPNSVNYIDGASFHGCESLETVYILGPAANLQGEFAEVGSDQASSTFSANTTLCKEAVNHCTFYTTDDNYAGYKNDPVWSRIDEGGDDSDGHFGNWLKTIPAEKRVIPTTWVTALFPQKVNNYVDKFGEGTLVAVMDKCDSYTSKVINGKTTRIYQLTFKLLEGTDIPENRPVLIKAGTATEYTFYTDADKQEKWWKNNSDVFFFTDEDQVTAPDGATITMKGRYLPHQLQPWDFYFMYKNKEVAEDGTVTYPTEPAKFYRVPDQKNAATIKACRCWWTISVDGIKSKAPAMANTMNSFFVDDTTGIKNVDTIGVVVEGIYDMQGRKLDIKESELPQGLYIVNGKKVVVK